MSKHQRKNTADTLDSKDLIARSFPTPKFVFTICAPTVVIARSTEIRKEWKDDVVGRTSREDKGISTSFRTNTSNSTETIQTTKVRMASLLVKMLNRLIREEIIPYEAVFFICGPEMMYVRILVPSSAIPAIVTSCEHIGVGNVVGMCFICQLEAALLPPALAGPTKQIDIIHLGTLPLSTNSKAEKGVLTMDSRISSADEIAANVSWGEDSVSTVLEEPEFEDEMRSSLKASVNVPFMKPERKEQLQEMIEDARKEWRDTASRVRVAQVVEEVSQSAALTLDYIAFVICAAVVAAVGLVADSSVTVIASMLISPIMGPVLGITFGTTVRLKKLIRTSLRNEILSIGICIIVGMIASVIATVAGVPAERDWPSFEIVTRGDWHALVSSVLVALPSGVAVALSTLNKNSSGIIGVAISLSLLPPAVNAGVSWAYALMLLSDKYDPNEGDTTNYGGNGLVSIAITFVNIACIWIAGVATFRLKEVAPIKQKNAFWTNDIAVYRNAHDSHIEPNLEVLNDGIKATIELQEAEAATDDVTLSAREIKMQRMRKMQTRRKAFRRRSAVGGHELDDSFLPDHIDLFGSVVGDATSTVWRRGGQGSRSALKREETKAELLENAYKLGGIEEAGEALFDDELTGYKGDAQP